jgi:hypothetical protein
MIAQRIAGATHVYGAPKGWKPEEHGECGQLTVRQSGDFVESAWEPTPAELAMLKAGGHVVLSVFGGQPPVTLRVEPRDTGEPPASDPDHCRGPRRLAELIEHQARDWQRQLTDGLEHIHVSELRNTLHLIESLACAVRVLAAATLAERDRMG